MVTRGYVIQIKRLLFSMIRWRDIPLLLQDKPFLPRQFRQRHPFGPFSSLPILHPYQDERKDSDWLSGKLHFPSFCHSRVALVSRVSLPHVYNFTAPFLIHKSVHSLVSLSLRHASCCCAFAHLLDRGGWTSPRSRPERETLESVSLQRALTRDGEFCGVLSLNLTNKNRCESKSPMGEQLPP